MCVCVCTVYPPTVVMGPPEEFLAIRALGLCGLREQTIKSLWACLKLKATKFLQCLRWWKFYLACSR